jgi:hypothetical protein
MRSFSSTTSALLASGRFGLSVIARLVLGSGTWGASDAPDSFTYGGQTYLGFDRAFEVDVDPASGEGRGAGGRLRLSATDPALLATFQNETYRARQATVGVLIIDPATGLAIDDITLLDARLDSASIEEGTMKFEEPDSPVFSTLAIDLAPRAMDMDRNGVRVRSDEDQRTYRDSADGFFKDVRQLPNAEITWGSNGPQDPYSAGANRASEQRTVRFMGQDVNL